MPAGKANIQSASGWRPQLPDCSKMDWLLANRKKGWSEPSEEQKASYRDRVNRVLNTYIGAINTTQLVTRTEQNNVIGKASVAAKHFLSVVECGDENLKKERRDKLAERISYKALGQHSRLHLVRQVRRAGGNLSGLEHLISNRTVNICRQLKCLINYLISSNFNIIPMVDCDIIIIIAAETK